MVPYQSLSVVHRSHSGGQVLSVVGVNILHCGPRQRATSDEDLDGQRRSDVSDNLPKTVAAIDEALAALHKLRAELVALNNRPEQPTRGTIEFQGAVIPLPDEQSTSWERHDDPEMG